MRLIDADALWMDIIHSMDYCDDFLSFIDAAPTVPQWIPCSERLPDIMVLVLITMKRGKGYNQEPFQSVGYLDANGYTWWCAHDGTCTNQTVLAWMPLPEPYKGGERE